MPFKKPIKITDQRRGKGAPEIKGFTKPKTAIQSKLPGFSHGLSKGTTTDTHPQYTHTPGGTPFHDRRQGGAGTPAYVRTGPKRPSPAMQKTNWSE